MVSVIGGWNRSSRIFVNSAIAGLFSGLTFAGSPALPAAPSTPLQSSVLFEPNVGQTDPQVNWIARGPGYQLFLTQDSMIMALREGGKDAAQPRRALITSRMQPQETRSTVVSMKLNGSRSWQNATALEPAASVTNYLLDRDRKNWRTNVPNYARLKESAVYDGIDLVFYSHGGELEYDFEVAAGADPRQIRLAFDGVDRVRVDDESGDLCMTLASGRELRQLRPRIYQQVGRKQVEVTGRYEILSHGDVTFALADYDRTRPLVIDPTIAFTTFFMGESWDRATGIALDASGNAYITGYTQSLAFPYLSGIPSNGLGHFHGGMQDVYVAKLSTTGQILFSTYLGGTGDDYAFGIAVDASGVYVTGYTTSANFPSFPPAVIRQVDAYVAKLILEGNDLIYSKILGGSGGEVGWAIAVDHTGAAYVTGETTSADFPRAGARVSQLNGTLDAFVTKISPSGWDVVYSGYLGGSNMDRGMGIAVDQNGIVYFTGITWSHDLPITYAMQQYPGGTPTAFVGSINAAGSGVRFLRYLGGGNNDNGVGIALDPANASVYVVGETNASNFFTSPGAFQRTHPGTPGYPTGFIVKLGPSGLNTWSSYFGGSDSDQYLDYSSLTSVAVGPDGSVYFGGYTSSANIPGATPLAPNPTAGFVTKFSPSGNALAYTVRLGATVNSIAVDKYTSVAIFGPTIKVYTTGTRYTDGPGDSTDVFVVKLDEGNGGGIFTGPIGTLPFN